MRSWTRSVLTIWNPENQFEKSEYYNFVQSLFQGNLHELRSDTAVLSFNYDVYLEFLLSRALKVRQDMIAGKRTNDLLNSVTGGFFNPDQRDWFEQEGRFCVLKLHGSVVYPEAPGSPFSYELLFSTENTFQRRRLQMALEPTNVNDYPPIIFPWEAIRENGTFCGKDEFPHTERRHEFELFQRIWDRAEREVASAEKVSFVGISMHPFMEFGLKFLFRNCEPSKKIEIVVANPFNREIKVRAPNNVADSFISKPDPRCPGGKIDNFLSKRQAATHFDYNLRMVDSFNTFIAEEMG